MVTGHNYDLSVRIWDLATLQCLKYMAGHDIYDYHPEIPSSPEGHSEWVNAVVFAENDTILFSASADKTIKKWDAEDEKCLQTVEAGNSSIESLCLTDNGKILISGSSDTTIKIWEASSLKCLATILFFEDQWIAYTPDLNFDCSSGAEKLFSWVAGKKVFPAEILFEEYHKPDLIAGILS
ncbi:MAG: hypothetical protein LWY06_06540 [Firmicutes bacterium]|nr:hypothetical protein [Bacillota bacterium]